MNMYYLKINPPVKLKPSPRAVKRGLPPHLKKRKPRNKKEILEWICSWNIWIPLKILCS
jgi:hypothetical protein